MNFKYHKLLICLTILSILQPVSLNAKNKTKNKITNTKKVSKFIAKKNAISNNNYYIDQSYFLQITLDAKDCEKLFTKSCFFRDKLFQEPYLHETTLTIYLGKIYATQFDLSRQITNIAVKDGNYNLKINDQTKVEFEVKSGETFNLKLLNGSLAKELQLGSKCQKAETLYNFYNIYKKEHEIITNSGFYKDQYNFNGINEYALFSQRNNAAEIMAISKDANQKISAIANLKLCKIEGADVLNVRHISEEECAFSAAEECSKYQKCEDVIAIENCEVTLFKGDLN